MQNSPQNESDKERQQPADDAYMKQPFYLPLPPALQMSNERLLEIAERLPPPQEWYDGDEEELFVPPDDEYLEDSGDFFPGEYDANSRD